MKDQDQSYNDHLTISCINWCGQWGDKTANMEKMKEKTLEASNMGAAVVVFPELALSGYECSEEIRFKQKTCSMHFDLAETIPGPSTEEIAKVAQELGVYVIFGMPEIDAQNREFVYNSVAVIGPEGLVGRYRKLHLPDVPQFTEKLCFVAGNELPVFDTSFGRIGIQICMDFAMVPELTRLQSLKGAQIVISPSAIPLSISRYSSIPQLAARRGVDNQVYTAVANHTGKERTVEFAGYSTIAGPSPSRPLNIYANAEESEEIVTATLNMKSLRYIQNKRNMKRKINWKFIADEYNTFKSL